MKKLIIVALILVVGFLIPHVAFGYSVPGGSLQKPQYTIPKYTPQSQSGPCNAKNPVVIDTDYYMTAYNTFINALDDYDNPANINPETGRYEVCFRFIHDPLILSLPIIFPAHSPAENRDTAIYGIIKEAGEQGINIRAQSSLTDPLFQIQSYLVGQHVHLENITITNVVNGLKIFETNDVEIVNAHITGASGSTGSCIEFVNSDNSIIRGSDVSQCGTGILLDGTDNTLIGASDAQHYEQDKVLIHNNGVGIHLVNGDGNRWGYNSIYANNVDPGILTGTDGILVAAGANEGILSPVVAKSSDKGVLQCERDESGKIVSRKIEFKTLQQAGVIIILQADDYEQGIKYITECEVDADGVCVLNELPSWLNIPEGECGLEGFYTVGLFNGTSSSAYTGELSFNGPSSIPAIPTDLPAGTMPQATDDSDITASSEEADILSSGASGGASGAGGAAGMGMKCGGTLVPSATLNGSALLHSLVWMTMPLLPVMVFRRRKKGKRSPTSREKSV